MESNIISTLWLILFGGFAVSVVFSFVYMTKKRGFLSALLWSLIPFRFLLSFASDTDYDDNPVWLERVQTGIIVGMGVLWLLGKVNT